ncbi:hypothetical protein [Citrobacter phage CF1 DK-2017]|uniref:HNH nuclease domain-containing protein n=1 Tax=Citrobacter phage CF1 DK-2017 TaxID=2267237 RepID=A0A1W6DXL7_9CAUD|nr:HNH endonuclease [Citrobacter phage CF1 DK-2017]ARK07629.1 hypothetical protein [Citrobacter phage CF1 DK-2017]
MTENERLKILSSMLRYENGVLYWRERRNGVKPDLIAGTITKNGYVSIGANGIKAYAHRIVWFMHYGEIPKGFDIDHINHDRTDNIIENLRLVSRSDNLRNKGKVLSSSGEMGVYWSKAAGRWEASLTVDGKKRYLGLFDTVEQAREARVKADKIYGYHKNHGVIS